MGCAIKIKANGKDSELQVKLAKALNSETRAEDYMAIISGKDFKKKFGDWEAAGISGELTTDMESRMENLEPQLHRKKGTNQYYFELPGKTKFFINRKKLADIPLAFSPGEFFNYSISTIRRRTFWSSRWFGKHESGTICITK